MVANQDGFIIEYGLDVKALGSWTWWWHSIAIVVKLDGIYVIDVWINFKLHYSCESNGEIIVRILRQYEHFVIRALLAMRVEFTGYIGRWFIVTADAIIPYSVNTWKAA